MYIGYTKHSIMKRFSQHIRCAKKLKLNKFYNAIRHYGSECFTIEQLYESTDKEAALNMEIEFIRTYNSIEDGYNTHIGGNGGSIGCPSGIVFTDEHKKNISLNHHDVSGTNNPFYGKTHSTESKAKIGNREYPVGPNHMWYGKKWESQFKSGSQHPLSIPITVNGIQYESINQAMIALGVSRRKVIKLSKETEKRLGDDK
jgi:group I intron endonuclease